MSLHVRLFIGACYLLHCRPGGTAADAAVHSIPQGSALHVSVSSRCSRTNNRERSSSATTLAMRVQRGGASKPPAIGRRRRPRRDGKTCDTRDTRNTDGIGINNDDNKDGASSSSPSSTSLPTVSAVLLPRSISIPQLIRLVSATILSASLCACFGTAGLPYENAVRSTLGKYPLRDNPWTWQNMLAAMLGDSGTAAAAAAAALPKLLPLDHFLARKIAQCKSDMLPPLYLPASGPLLGCLLAFLLNVGLTMLLPQWIVAFDVLLNYRRVDVQRLADEAFSNRKDLPFKIRHHLEKGSGNDEEDDNFYRSSLLTHRGGSTKANSKSSDPNTGVGVLVRLPEAERAATREKHRQTVYWLHSCDEPDAASGDGSDKAQRRRRYYFEHSQRRIYFDPNTGRCTDGGPRLHMDCAVHELVNEQAIRGLSDAAALEAARARYAKYNSFVLPQPTIQLAFGARISSPLAVLQLLGRSLSVLEDHVLSSLARLAMTLGHHFIAARRSIAASKELAAEVRTNAEEVGEMQVHVLRPVEAGGQRDTADAQWRPLAASVLLPGDVFYLSAAAGKKVHMPVDALILDGGCVTNEAVLTGESVPQVKRPLDIVASDRDVAMQFDMDGEHRGSVLFAGTSVLYCDGALESDQEDAGVSFPTGTNAVKCLALRTGSYSSEGEIVRSLSKSAGHYGQISNSDTERDALRLIAALSGFALLSCASLFVPIPGQASARPTSPFRRIIQCTRILMASIPSDIPLAISSIAAACTENLRKEAEVVCSEPGSLLTSAHVDMVVLDKTGTMTAETQSLKQIILSPDQSDAESSWADAVLAGCHSLETIKDGTSGTTERVIGDPVDLACLEHTDWNYYGGQNKTATAPSVLSKSLRDDSIIRIWQLKTFPFDATRCCSSALLLVLDASGSFRLLKTVKGAPDVMRSKLDANETAQSWYDRKVDDFSAQGARLITLAAQVVPLDDEIVTTLFPKGLSSLSISEKRPKKTKEKTERAIRRAQAKASKYIHRGDIEADTLAFVGVACFSAGLRPSTPRVIRQLQGAGIRTMMLTGDGVDAAISIALQAGIIKGVRAAKIKKKKRIQDEMAEVAILASDSKSKLTWKLVSVGSRKRRIKQKVLEASHSTSARIFDEAILGHCFIACSGEAIDTVLSNDIRNSASAAIRERLAYVSVIARASPSTKESVVRHLKNTKTVMMTGDGTNDVNAMKLADVSAALLNGFGSEVTSSADMEDKRRLHRILKERRKLRKGASSSSHRDLHEADSATLTKQILQARVNAAVEQFKSSSSFSGLVGDLRAVFKEERLRKSALKKGGGEAARILAREEKLRASLAGKSAEVDTVILDDSDDTDEEQLKPGEACLAAACTLLRPSIDGTDAIVRAGVAAAACSLTIHRSIALNALLSCFNLSTLYRDGFRYGKYMWNVESTLISAVDQFAYASACTMRPKIATVRPETTIFTSAGALSILGQAVVHLAVLYTGADFGRRLEEASENSKARSIRIKWAGAGIGDALQLAGLEGSEGGTATGILGRPKFRPNQVTNAVFLLSIVQNAVITLTNHMGAPFYGRILENRNLTLSLMSSLLFAVACVSESFPDVNKMLQLAPFPSQKTQITFLLLIALDLLGCFAIEHLCRYFLMPERSAALQKARDSVEVPATTIGSTAADKHEMMLFDDKQQNRALVLRLSLVALSFIGKTFVGKKR